MRNTTALVVLVFTAILAFTVSTRAGQVFVGSLSGRQEVPPNSSTGSGTCKFTLGVVDNNGTLDCTYSLTSPGVSLQIFSNVPRGQNGGSPAITTPLNGQTGAFQMAVGGLSGNHVAFLRSNLWYINLTSQAFPQGELRAQLKLANGTYNDYDADGRADLVGFRPADLAFYARGSLDGNLIVGQVGQSGDSVSLNVDFDGDAKSDFSTGRLSAQMIWRILNSSTGALQETHWGNSTLGDFFAAGDYDGDGRSDIAVFRGGSWYILESATGTVRYDFFGQGGDIPTPNDYDRDGKADLAVARSEGGLRVWYRLNSSNQQFSAVQFGLSSDSFFAGRADYDGDGAADISVIRNVSGQRHFYILRSSDSQFQAVQFGLSSDLPKLADYDGDGKTDIAVARAITGGRNWYILQTSDGQVRYDFWGLPSDF